MRTEEERKCLLSREPYPCSVVFITAGDDMPARHSIDGSRGSAQFKSLFSIMAERHCVTTYGEGEYCPVDRDLIDIEHIHPGGVRLK